ncbi:DUF3558 family protein [Actinoalloteichus spitiensis]|uniref:DUF3558 family protein n=1 Tax=Actinoalloteichus spitiensis TaxID=252394 RepID=UPI00030C70C0|nr:DUF3558 family protein [Actinoalloteichus spitiensis]
MRTSGRRGQVLVGLLLAVLVVISGCARESAGHATPTTHGDQSETSEAVVPGTGGASALSSSPGSSSVGATLESLDPCELLDEETLTSVGIDPATGERNSIGINHACTYAQLEPDQPIVLIQLNTFLGADAQNYGDASVEEIEVDGRRALQVEDDIFCEIVLDLDPGASAVVRASTIASGEACPIVEAVAPLLNKALP